MKIVHLCLASFYIDNYSYQENLLPKYHRLMGHDVTVIASLVTFDKFGKYALLPSESSYQASDNYKVCRIDYKHPFYRLNRLLRRYNKLYALLLGEAPDIIFVHGVQFSDIKYVVKYKQNNSVTRLFCDNHADWVNSATNLFSRNILHKLIWKHYAKKAEPYIERFYGVTPLRCTFLEKMYGISSSKIDLLIMGVDDTAVPWQDRDAINILVRSSLGISSNDFVIVTGGKIDERKNIHLLIEAVKNLSYKNLHLIIFGNIVPEFKDRFEQLLGSPNVHFVGWKMPEQITEYLLSANLAVFPGTHSVLWEQVVGLGIPAIFKFWNGMTHVDVGGNCFFLKEDSRNEIMNLISRIYLCKDVYNSMKEKAENGASHFIYSNIAKKAISDV